MPSLVHLLAPEEEFDGIAPPLALRLLLPVRLHLEYLLISDVHGDQAPREHLYGPLGPLIHLGEHQRRRVGRRLLFDELGDIGHFYLRVYLVVVRTICLRDFVLTLLRDLARGLLPWGRPGSSWILSLLLAPRWDGRALQQAPIRTSSGKSRTSGGILMPQPNRRGCPVIGLASSSGHHPAPDQAYPPHHRKRLWYFHRLPLPCILYLTSLGHSTQHHAH